MATIAFASTIDEQVEPRSLVFAGHPHLARLETLAAENGDDLYKELTDATAEQPSSVGGKWPSSVETVERLLGAEPTRIGATQLESAGMVAIRCFEHHYSLTDGFDADARAADCFQMITFMLIGKAEDVLGDKYRVNDLDGVKVAVTTHTKLTKKYAKVNGFDSWQKCLDEVGSEEDSYRELYGDCVRLAVRENDYHLARLLLEEGAYAYNEYGSELDAANELERVNTIIRDQVERHWAKVRDSLKIRRYVFHWVEECAKSKETQRIQMAKDGEIDDPLA